MVVNILILNILKSVKVSCKHFKYFSKSNETDCVNYLKLVLNKFKFILLKTEGKPAYSRPLGAAHNFKFDSMRARRRTLVGFESNPLLRGF